MAQLLTAMATVAALLFSAQTLRSTQSQIKLAEQEQLAGRFGTATGNLDEDGHSVRLGGIYELEQLAHDSPHYHPTIMEVLTGFVRNSTFGRPCLPPAEGGAQVALDGAVQAALTVIGRRKTAHDRTVIDLRGRLPPGRQPARRRAGQRGSDQRGPDRGQARLAELHRRLFAERGGLTG